MTKMTNVTRYTASRWMLTVAGVLGLTAVTMAVEETVESATSSMLNTRGLNEKGAPGVISYQINKDTTVEIKNVTGINLSVGNILKNWKVDVTWTKPKGAGKDSKARLATKITVLCDWIEGILNANPSAQGVSLQTRIDDKAYPALNVLFFPGMVYKGPEDKKPKDFPKGSKVELLIVSGGQPPIAMVFQIPAPPTPVASPTPTKTPIPITLPPSAVPTPVPPANPPADPAGASQPAVVPAGTSQPAGDSLSTSQPVASQPVANPPAASQAATSSPAHP